MTTSPTSTSSNFSVIVDHPLSPGAEHGSDHSRPFLRRSITPPIQKSTSNNDTPLLRKPRSHSSASDSHESFHINIDETPGQPTGYRQHTFHGFRRKHTPISLQFNNVGLTLPSGKVILSGVTGEFPHSRLLAIMGPSGAGKTSFLNALCGRAKYGKVTGEIFVNHVPAKISDLQHIVGFVPQDDILHPELTVEENLMYSALLRLPRNMDEERKKSIVNDVIAMLNLENVRHSIVGDVEKRGISGGQRKRVNIGLELVADPAILFMDEPTSGLDASAALDLLNSLRQLAALGLTIITVVHQPRYSIFSAFHSVLLLQPGGKTAYLGRTANALSYFERLGYQLPPHENPADFFLDVISGAVRRIDEITSRQITYEGNTEEEEGKTNAASPSSNRSEGEDDLIDFSTAWEQFAEDQRRLEDEKLARRRRRSSAHSRMDSYSLAIPPTGSFAASVVPSNVNSGQNSPVNSPDTRSRSLSTASTLSTSTGSMEGYLAFNTEEDHGNMVIPSTSLASRAKRFFSNRKSMNSDKSGSDDLFTKFAEKYSVLGHQPPPDDVLEDDFYGQIEEEPISIYRLNHHSTESTDCSCSLFGCFSFSSSHSRETKSKFDDMDNPYYSMDHIVFGLPTPRLPPSFRSQFLLHLRRTGTKVFRTFYFTILDIMLIVFLAFVVGIVYGDEWTLGQYTTQSVFSSLAMGLCACVASLRLFGTDRLIFWRESQVGVNLSAYYLSLVCVELHKSLLYPGVFVAVYYPMAIPMTPISQVYLIFLSCYFAMSGLGLLLSTLVKPISALMIGTMLPLTVGGFLSGANPPLPDMSPTMRFFTNFSFTRWTIEALAMSECEYPNYYGASAIKAYQQRFQWDWHPLWKDTFVLLSMGLLFRILAGLGVWRFSKSFKA